MLIGFCSFVSIRGMAIYSPPPPPHNPFTTTTNNELTHNATVHMATAPRFVESEINFKEFRLVQLQNMFDWN